MKVCSIEDCSSTPRMLVRGLCPKHISRFYRNGDPLLGGLPSAEERFDSKWFPEPNSGCHIWLASLDKDGYGRFSVSHRKGYRAHRFAYERVNGPIPEGLVIDHKCRIRCCVNPEHLRAVTYRMNAVENSVGIVAQHAAKTHCIRGHELFGDNLYRERNGRHCRSCRRVTERTRKALKRMGARFMAEHQLTLWKEAA